MENAQGAAVRASVYLSVGWKLYEFVLGKCLTETVPTRRIFGVPVHTATKEWDRRFLPESFTKTTTTTGAKLNVLV